MLEEMKHYEELEEDLSFDEGKNNRENPLPDRDKQVPCKIKYCVLWQMEWDWQHIHRNEMNNLRMIKDLTLCLLGTIPWTELPCKAIGTEQVQYLDKHCRTSCIGTVHINSVI